MSKKYIKNETNVSIILEVYNEENRIESCLKSFQWADDLIVYNKSSSDSTKSIAEKYATEVIDVDYTSASENIVNNVTGKSTKEWVGFPTASSLIHPNLVDKIVELTTNPDFNYDVIYLPYALYSLGINSKYSPWTCAYKLLLIRRSCLVLSTKLHYEINYNSNRIFTIPYQNANEFYFHCTNKDADDLFTRHLRYVKYEANYSLIEDKSESLRKPFLEIIKSLFIAFIKRKWYKLGWDGVALSLSYVSYFIMKFIYIWDSRRISGGEIYSKIRREIDELWDNKTT
jgi:glycosyltransferase involved in cell wall biosynthesis